MKEIQHFSVKVDLQGSQSTLEIKHSDETFVIDTAGKKASIINNGDNSWSIVEGQISQETANVIGQAIEDYYRDANF